MDAMVSARVPVEIRDQVNEALKKIGSTPTELINRTYKQFLQTGTLPGDSPALKPGKRKLSREQKAQLRDYAKRTTLSIPESFFEGKSYKQILSERLKEEYEALA